MCMFSSPSVPAAAPLPQVIDTAQIQTNVGNDDAQRRQRAAALGRASTILTGNQGIASPVTAAPKTLLGQ